MSEFPGYSLEELIEDNFGVADGERFERIKAFYEPHRETLEYNAGEFDKETQGWRDYRYGLWSTVPDFPEDWQPPAPPAAPDPPVPALDTGDRQLLAMALSELSLTCPGFDHALSELAKKFPVDVEIMRKSFRELRCDVVKPVAVVGRL